MPQNMRHNTKCDWLLYWSVIWPLERSLAIQSGQGSQTFSRQSMRDYGFGKGLDFTARFRFGSYVFVQTIYNFMSCANIMTYYETRLFLNPSE